MRTHEAVQTPQVEIIYFEFSNGNILTFRPMIFVSELAANPQPTLLYLFIQDDATSVGSAACGAVGWHVTNAGQPVPEVRYDFATIYG